MLILRKILKNTKGSASKLVLRRLGEKFGLIQLSASLPTRSRNLGEERIGCHLSGREPFFLNQPLNCAGFKKRESSNLLLGMTFQLTRNISPEYTGAVDRQKSVFLRDRNDCRDFPFRIQDDENGEKVGSSFRLSDEANRLLELPPCPLAMKKTSSRHNCRCQTIRSVPSMRTENVDWVPFIRHHSQTPTGGR